MPTDLRSIAAALKVGHEVEILATSSRKPARYVVTAITGSASRQIAVKGGRGSVRVIVDDGEALWLRADERKAKHGTTHRRVLELRRVEHVDPALRRALAAAQQVAGWLPDGYALKTEWVRDGYYHRPVRQNGDPAPLRFGAVMSYSDPREAVIRALWHSIEAADEASQAREHEIALLTAKLRDAQVNANRCSHALQQIREMVNGHQRSGTPLPSSLAPEQVAADVGHRLVLG